MEDHECPPLSSIPSPIIKHRVGKKSDVLAAKKGDEYTVKLFKDNL
jgi:hypothetical protein